MFRRTLILVGTVTISLVVLLGLIWFACSSVSVAHAKSPATDTTNSALPRLLGQVPPGCVPVNSDIGSNTTWTGSCYHVMTNTVTIYAGVSLVISPPSGGTWVYFEDGAQLQVLGDLQALGTTSRPITFTAVHTSNPWVGIILEQDAGGDRIQYSVIEYAQTGVKVNDEDNLTIRFNTFRHNRFGVTGGGAVSGDTDDSVITNNTIHSCSNGVILNESFGNDISNNTIYDIDQDGIALIAKTTVGGNSNTITSNEIHDCDVSGVRLEKGSLNTIQGNAVYRCGSAGLVISEQSRPLVQSNQVFDNAQDGVALAGVVVTNGSENVELRANQILSNGSSLGAYVAAVYVENMSSVFNQLAINDNVIHDTYGTGVYYAANNGNTSTVLQANAICSVPSYELDNQRGGHTIDGRYDWWGTNAPAMGVNYAGSVSLTPWITLAVTTVPTSMPGNLGGTTTVLVSMNDGAGHTVPDGARQVRLASSAGTLSPAVVTLDGNGQALSTFTLTEIPPGDQVIISATAFCDYVANAILMVERTDVAINKEVGVTQVVAGDQLVYQITYSNTTDVVATDVYITDSLPAGTTWAGDTATASGWTRLSTSPQPIWFIPTLPSGAYGSFVLTVDVPADAACGALLTNWVTISTSTIEETTTNNSASAGPVAVIQPSVVITKTGDALSKAGDDVTYEFQITNSSCPAGSPSLILDSITDVGIGWPGLGNLTDVARANGCDPLPFGASCSFTVQRTVPVGAPDPLPDYVTAHYHPQGFTVDVSDSESHAVNLFQPSITFDKSGDTLSKAGDDVNYALTLNNTSSFDTPNLVCTVTDPMLGLNQNVTLASGASHVINATYTVPTGAPDPLVNTAQVSCSPVGFPNVLTASDAHSVNLFQPSITFDKSGDALSKVGDDVNYAFTLNNTSSFDTPNLVCTVTDPMLGLNQNVTLASGASHVINATYTVPTGAPDPLVNTAQVSCSPVGFPNVLTDSDDHSVNLFQPSVQVEKTGADVAYMDDIITYTFRITNTGSTDSPPLILDSVVDVGTGWSGLGDITTIAHAGGCDALPVGASCSFTAQYTAPTCSVSPLTNTVTVHYHPQGFLNDVAHSDSHAVAIECAVNLFVTKHDDVESTTLLGPTLMDGADGGNRFAQLLMTAWENALLAPTQNREFVFEGDIVTYTITIINTGAYTATGVVLTETLPLYAEYLGYGWTHGHTRTYTLAVGTLPPDAWQIHHFVVRIADTLPYTVSKVVNRVCGGSVEPDLDPAENCRYENTPVRQRPTLAKTPSVLGIPPGSTITFTVSYSNPNSVAFSDARITDTLPPGSLWNGDTADAEGWTRLQTTPQVVWHMPTLAPDTQGSFILSVTIPATATCGITLTNAITLSVSNDGISYLADSDTADFRVLCPIDLLAIKNDNIGLTQPRAFVREGDLITYTIVVVNVGFNTVNNVVLSETLPAHTDYVGYNWTHVGGTTYITTVGTLPPGAGRAYYFTVRVHDTLPPGLDYVTNRVCTWGIEPDDYLANNCSDEDTPIRPWPLQVIKTADTCIMPGDEFDYTITYQNTTTDTTYANVVLTDTLSSYVTYVGGPEWTCVGQICNRTISTIPPGASGTLVLQAQLSASFPYTMQTVFTNVVAISGGNRYLLVTSIDVGPDLALVKNDNVGLAPPGMQQREVVAPGELITYTIIYLNGGLGPATNVVLTETLPQYTTYAGDASWQDAGGGLYTRSVGNLAPGQGGMTSFVVRVDDPLPPGASWAINLVEIGSATPECDLTNNRSTEQTPLTGGGVLTFTLHKDGPMSTYPNSVITYTIVTVNNGPPAPGVTLSDAVPNGTIFIPGSCSYSINGGPGQPCNSDYPDPSDVMWQADLATGDRVVTTFSVRVAVGTMGVVMLQNCATLDWSSGQATDCTDMMVVLPFLEKTGPATAYSGERITYTVVSENNTEMPIPDATLSDPVPNGTVFIPGTCSYSMNGGAPQPCDPDYPDPSDTMWQEDLAPGDRITTTFSVAVTTGSMGVADVQNCATLGWEGSQTTDCFTTRVSPSGLGAVKTAPRVACPNDVITYTIVASDVSGVAMPGVVLSDTIPNGAIYVPGSCSYRVNAGPPQPCGLPPLLWQRDFAPGDRVTTTFAVTVTAGTMGWPIGNCAVFTWGGRQIWACATTIVGRCDQRVYVANRDSGTVDVFDLNGFGYVRTIPMGINPFGMVTIGDFLFVVDFDEPSDQGRLYVVNTLLDRVVDAPLVGAHPIHIAAYDRHIYVASHSSRPAITVYDYVAGQIVAQPVLDRHLTYEFGFFGATTDESRGCVYLTKRDFGSLGIWRICPPSSSGPWVPEFVYATNEANQEKPSSILYHPDLDRVYVTFGLIDELWVFDPGAWQLLERIPTGIQDPTDPGYGGHGLAALGQCVFVSNYMGQSVTAVVDGSCVDTTRVMGAPPEPSTSRVHRVYLPLVIKNYGGGQQGPQQQRIVTIPMSGRPKGLVAGAGNLLFVTLPEDGSGNPLNRIAVIDTETLQVIHEIQALGDHPHTVVLRPITVTGVRSNPSGTLLLP